MNKADFEFVREEEQEDPVVKLTWKDRFNFLGIGGAIVGQIRDSSGRPNNILGLLYVFSIFFFVGIWWATHPTTVRHELDLTCEGQRATQVVLTKPASRKRARSKKKKDLGSRVKRGLKKASKAIREIITKPSQVKKMTSHYSCQGANIKVNLTLPPPPPLPSSFYWALVTPILFLLGAYLARHPKMRSFMVRMMLAWRAIKSGTSSEDLQRIKQEVMDVVNDVKEGKPISQAVAEVSKSPSSGETSPPEGKSNQQRARPPEGREH